MKLVKNAIEKHREPGASRWLRAPQKSSGRNTQADYRSVQVNYLNLVASYFNATRQLNLAVGREVIQ